MACVWPFDYCLLNPSHLSQAASGAMAFRVAAAGQARQQALGQLLLWRRLCLQLCSQHPSATQQASLSRLPLC